MLGPDGSLLSHRSTIFYSLFCNPQRNEALISHAASHSLRRGLITPHPPTCGTAGVRSPRGHRFFASLVGDVDFSISALLRQTKDPFPPTPPRSHNYSVVTQSILFLLS
jgi:hypothetical protein